MALVRVYRIKPRNKLLWYLIGILLLIAIVLIVVYVGVLVLALILIIGIIWFIVNLFNKLGRLQRGK